MVVIIDFIHFLRQVREKRDRLAQLVFEIDQNENLLRCTEQEVATLEQSTTQTNVIQM